MGLKRTGKYRDPDITALVEAKGGESEPRALVQSEACALLAELREWGAVGLPPFERIAILASLRGYSVEPMQACHDHERDAVVLRKLSGAGGQIFYNEDRPQSRIVFSIAHEITHGFFPVTGSGVRFREMTADAPPETNELERLCDVGAAELVMPTEEFRETAGKDWTIRNIPKLIHTFGASFEATLYRLASAYPGVAVAGLLRYRRTKADELKVKLVNCGQQQSLFGTHLWTESLSVAEPKYRRQSIHLSSDCPKRMLIPWNKSFDRSSRVYHTNRDGVVAGYELLPVTNSPKGVLEAVDAPYQRPDADPDHPDVLFYWRAA